METFLSQRKLRIIYGNDLSIIIIFVCIRRGHDPYGGGGGPRRRMGGFGGRGGGGE